MSNSKPTFMEWKKEKEKKQSGTSTSYSSSTSSTSSTSSKPSFSEWKNNKVKKEVNSTVNTDYINSFITDANNFFSTAESDYASLNSGGNAKSLYESRSASWRDLRNRADTISSWLNLNKDNLDEETYNSLSGAIKEYRSYGSAILDDFEKAWEIEDFNEKDSGWLKKGKFGASVADAIQDFGAGIIGFGENALDYLATIGTMAAKQSYSDIRGIYDEEDQARFESSLANVEKSTSEFVAKDLYNEEDVMNKIMAGVSTVRDLGNIKDAYNEAYTYIAGDENNISQMEKDSVFASQADGLWQSAGQMLATSGLQKVVGVPWWLSSFATSFGGEAESALNQGATMDQATISGAISGGAEVLSELLGGVSFGGTTLVDLGVDALSSKISSKFGKALVKYGLGTVLDMASEGAEETFTEYISAFGRWLTYQNEGTLSEMLKSEEMTQAAIDAFIGGVILGGVGGGVETIGGKIATNKEAKKLYGANAPEFVAEALEVNPEDKFAQKMQAKVEKGKTLSGGQINRLINTSESTIHNQDVAKMKSAVEARLTEVGESGDVSAIAEIIVKKELGEDLTRAEKQMLDNSANGEWVADELSNNPAFKKLGGKDFNNEWVEKIGTTRINHDRYNRGVTEDVAESPSPTSQTSVQGEKTAPVTENAPVKAEATESEIEASTDNGKAVPTELKEASEKYGAQAQAMVNAYEEGQDVAEYEKAYNMAFTMGVEGVNKSYALNSASLSYLTPIQKVKAYEAGSAVNEALSQAYEAGRIGNKEGLKNPRLTTEQSKEAYAMGEADIKKEIADKQKAIDSLPKTNTPGKGKVTYEGSVALKKLNSAQKTQVKALEVLADSLGTKFHVFESQVDAEGNRYYTMPNGKVTGANGWYDPDTGEIWIDLHAGKGGRGTMLFTAGHELTHFIKHWSPTKFKVFADFLIEKYGEKGVPVDELIANRIEDLKKNGRTEGKTDAEIYDLAYEEVVADSCEAMLTDGDAISNIAELKAKDKTLWEKIKSFLTDLVAKIKKMYALLKPDSTEGDYVAEMLETAEELRALWVDALVEASDNYSKFSTANIRGNTDGAVIKNEVTDALIGESKGELLFSMNTEYNAFPKQTMSLSTGEGTILDTIAGLEATEIKGLTASAISGYTGRAVREFAMRNNGFNKTQIAGVNKFMDSMAEFMKEAGVTYRFIGLKDVENAQLHYSYNRDGSIKSIVLSAMVKNGDYPVNFDLSSICKKRVAMSALIDKLAKRGTIDNGTVKLTPSNIFKINEALKDAGYETACLGCFVESKRYNSLEWAKKFCDKWNAAVKKVNPNATYFGYGNATFNEDSFTIEQAIKIDNAANKYIKATKTERLANALAKYKVKEQAGQPLVAGKVLKVNGEELNTFSKAARERLEKSDTISDELKNKYLTCDVSTLNMADVEFLLENGILPGAALSNKQAVTELVKSGETYQHLLRPSDLLTDRGISKLEALPNFHGVLYGHYGSGTPKLMQSYTPYNSEIALLPTSKGDQSLAEYLYTIAGVRMQSFSDFQIQNIYDYLQMVADLAARKVPAHAYTKEISFAKLLGMTGIKVNLSVMFDIDFTADKAHAGLTKLNRLVHKGEYAKVVLEDAQGKWVYNIGDYQTQRMFEEAYPEEARRFLQSIGFADAVKLQTSQGYSSNCGIIGVGYSDLGIFAMLDDNRIRYIIPYHASSLPADIKVATHIELGTDYTPYQNNMKIVGIVDSNGNKVNWTIKEAYKRLGSGQAVINELNDKVRNEGWVVTTKKAQTGHGTYGLYEDLKQTTDPRQTASNFMDWCIGNSTLPLFYQFASHNNYYKLLYDYNVYDCVTEEYAPQQAVTNTYPTMVDGQVQPANVADGDFNTEHLKSTINKQMAFMDNYSRNLDEDLDKLADNMEKGKYSLKDSITDKFLYSDRVLMGSLFSGGGTLEAGLVYQMLDKEFAVEYNEKIASTYTDNHGKEHMFVGDVRDFNSKDKQNVFYLHASPVCKNFSPASHSGGETTLDITTAQATTRVLEEQMPQVFTVENVKRYIGSEAYNLITNKLNELGYTWDVDVYKASDYGNATKRERMIIRAVKDGQLPAKPQKAPNITSWGEATRDLWETDLIPSNLVKSKIEAIRNTPELKNLKLTKLNKPLMIYDTTKSKKITFAWADELAPTLTTKCGDARIIMPNGRVYAPTPKFMGRIQGLPDDYKYPKANTRAFTIIGNGIPTQLTKAVMGGVLDSAYEQTHDGQVLYSDRATERSKLEERDYTVSEIKDIFNRWNSDNELATLAEKVFEKLDNVILDQKKQGDKERHYLFQYAETPYTIRVTNADYIRKRAWVNRGVGVFSDDRGSGLYGITFDSEGLAALDNDQARAQVLLHEAIHAITVRAIDKVKKEIPKGTPLYTDFVAPSNWSEEQKGALALLQIFQQVGFSGYLEKKVHYGEESVYEMVAELSNPEFRQFLKKKSLWSRVVDAIKRILGIGTDNALDAASSALERILNDGVTTSNPNIRYSDRTTPVAQTFTSAGTSLPNQLPALFTDKNAIFVPNGTNVDIGAGKTPRSEAYLANMGVSYYPFDPFNRTRESNTRTLNWLMDGNLADTVTCANVLNVIDTKSARSNVILEAAKALKPNGTAYFTTHEGSTDNGKRAGDGIARQTGKDKFQNYRKTETYLDEIREWFDNVERKGSLIVAKEPKSNLPKATWEVTPGEAIKYQDRPTNSMSTRSLLANALESTAQNDIEKNKLAQYKSKIDLIEKEQTKLADIKKQANDIRFTKGRTAEETKRMEALDFEAKQIENRINTYDRQLLNLESTKALKNVLNREKELARKKEAQKGREALARQRAKSAETQRELMNRYSESRKRAAEGREKTAIRKKISNVIKDLDHLLEHGNKKRNIKKEMQETVGTSLVLAEILFNDDIKNEDIVRLGIESVTEKESRLLNEYRDLLEERDSLQAKIEDLYKNGPLTEEMVAKLSKLTNDLNKVNGRISYRDGVLSEVFERERRRLHQAPINSVFDILITEYSKLETSENGYIKNAYRAEMKERLESLKKDLDGKIVKDMTVSQLEEVYKLFKGIKHMVSTANGIFREGRVEELSTYVSNTQGEIFESTTEPKDRGVVADKLASAFNDFSWNNLRPVDAIARLGSRTFERLYWDYIDGMGVAARDIAEAGEVIANARKKHGYSKWDMKLADASYTTRDGLIFKPSLADKLSIYAYSQRDQAEAHMVDGGFTFDTGKTYKDVENGKTYVRRKLSTTFRLSKENIQAIIDSLTQEQRDYVDAILPYLTDMGKKGNEVSMKLYGIELFGEKIYFPLQSSRDFLNSTTTELGATPTMSSLANSGFTKQTKPGANNPIVLRGFDDVVIDHIEKMSNYHGLTIPIENLRRVFDNVSKDADKNSLSTKALIGSRYGVEAQKYFAQLLTDLNGGISPTGAKSPIGKLFARAKKVQVAGNLSVMAQQYFSIIRAMEVIDPKYFVPFLNGEAKKTDMKQYEELVKYVPIAIIKEMNGFDVGAGGRAKDYIGYEGARKDAKYINKKIDDFTMLGAEAMDKLGWTTIWMAVKAEVASEQNLTPGTEEFYEACKKRFTEVATKTQVYDSVATRSGYMRSQSDAVKYATSFMGEPTVIMGRFFVAGNNLVKAIKSKNKANIKSASVSFIRAASVIAVSNLLGNLVKSLVYAGRDDEEDEALLEKWARNFASALRDDINPLKKLPNSLPFGRDIVSIIEGWDVERPDMTLIADIVTSTKKMFDGDVTLDDSLNLVGSLGNFFGKPLKNLIREVKAFINVIDDIFIDDIQPTDMWGALGEGFTGNERNKTDSLYRAIIRGDKDKVNAIKSTYKSDRAFESAMKQALRDNDPRIKEAAMAIIDGKYDKYTKLLNKIVREKNFDEETVMDAILAEQSAFNTKIKNAADAKDKGDDAEYKKIVKELRKEYKGICSQDEIIKLIKKAKDEEDSPEEDENKEESIYKTEWVYNAVAKGDTSEADAMREEIIETHMANGKTEEDAEADFNTSFTSAVKKHYDAREINSYKAQEMLVKYGGKTEEEATSKVQYWDFKKLYPEYDLSESAVSKYYSKVKPSGISINVYYDYTKKRATLTGDDLNGDGKTDSGSLKKKVLQLINSLPITRYQKNVLYLLNGYPESKINEAPWN